MYGPPEGREIVAEKLADWDRFIHSEDGVDPLIVMAAAHYQFEAIHPYFSSSPAAGLSNR
ncbi:hypothetical protein ACIA5E_30925 [Nocardia asteroides]|uniref:hypothetical protein n=1 Tax=Nocardia asteroides TaxID=1824 RepID=UPI00378F438C